MSDPTRPKQETRDEHNRTMSGVESELASVYDKWNEIVQLPTIGPMKGFVKDYNEYCSELLCLIKSMIDSYASLNNYWIQMNSAYTHAFNNLTANKSSVSTNWDQEQIRMALIDAFEDAYTSLFTSKDFAKAYDEVSSAQIELMNSIHRIFEKNMEILNMPTRSEVDIILRELTELRRDVRDLRQEFESVKKYGRENNFT
jgi:poly[(R)-3-hydroxyalkanoate] polymerase subunit PhaE